MTTLILLAGIALPLPLLFLFYRWPKKTISRALLGVGISLLLGGPLLPILAFALIEKVPLEEPVTASKTLNPSSQGFFSRIEETDFILYFDPHALPWVILLSPFLWCLGGALLIYPSLSNYENSPGRKLSLMIASLMFVSVIGFLVYHYYFINYGLGESM